jgi:hypothetical protein
MTTLGGANMEKALPPAQLGWWTVFFCCVYVLIHVLLNLTGGGSHEMIEPSWEILINEISGPFTIGIATSILILNFGMFLHHGARDIAIAYPNGIISSFIIFVIGLTIIQCAGHAQIYINECNRPSDFLEFQTLFSDPTIQERVNDVLRSKPSDCTTSGLWSFVAIATYLMVLFFIGLMDRYHENIYRKLKNQIPKTSKRMIVALEAGSTVGMISIGITLAKAVIIFTIPSSEIWYLPAKALISAVVILAEICLFIAVFTAHYKREI